MKDPVQAHDYYTGDGQKSAGQLMKEVSEDLSTLFRKEIELAKQELGTAMSAKVKGAAIVAVGGFLGFFALMFFLLAIRDAFDRIWGTWLADVATGGILLFVALIATLFARKKLATPISTELTKQTIKEDVEWAKTLGRR